MTPASFTTSFPSQLTPFYQSTPTYPFYTPPQMGLNVPRVPEASSEEEEDEGEEEGEQD
jgi:hypothetical protein